MKSRSIRGCRFLERWMKLPNKAMINGLSGAEYPVGGVFAVGGREGDQQQSIAWLAEVSIAVLANPR